ncbi:hypothetical protein CLOM_g1797 [Closterium sp. NIES-68]|nr:hypothetical protein CLOM_g1797 [Closterium sp. NIES-68]GJP75174.1 hypothetical protein CLOP_g5652 [Closterium sp. NIES-67]
MASEAQQPLVSSHAQPAMASPHAQQSRQQWWKPELGFPFPSASVLACHASALLLAGIIIYWVVEFYGGVTREIHWHPLLMTIGFIIVFGQGILAYRLLPFSRPARKIAHLVINGVALVLALVGVTAVFKFYQIDSVQHLYSLHSWCGSVVLVLFACQRWWEWRRCSAFTGSIPFSTSTACIRGAAQWFFCSSPSRGSLNPKPFKILPNP